MTRVLVLTVDRDDDLGVKAGIRGPVVGRRQVLTAALRLGIADPEESDTNAILGALHQHDRLVESTEGSDAVEIAILTGDERVGPKSDRAIANQMEQVIGEFQPDRGILVTDGAEDDQVLPLLQSRLNIDHVQKVIVRQSKGIESTYYYLVKAIEDPKWRAKLLVPLSIVLMIIGLGMILPNGAILIGTMPLLLGAYLLARGLGVEQHVSRIIRDMRENTDAAMISSLLWATMVIALIFAVAEGWRVYGVQTAADTVGLELVLLVFQGGLTWIIVSFLTLALSLLVLKWKRGSFSGRSLKVIAFAVVLWSLADTSLRIVLKLMAGDVYEFDPSTIWADWRWTLFTLVVFWLVSQGVKSWQERQQTQGRYWGI
jgi:putative membrane protein